MMRESEQDLANQGDKYVVIGSIKTRDGRLKKKQYEISRSMSVDRHRFIDVHAP
ncbi:hypothetical protein APHCRT_0163 [Anaplasma phagocytophilum str. CRT53-1]|uniref:Uncharacterized protein n=3 Tax=Anaplasma phagocytophilum TaxID=948 RepID=A0A0F3Q742_ANAPH|nr:hypothetical protein [Anaplasma phagocytophilum]EOA62949.1 hypothetical protein CRT38_00570 [Anaplasma phagocytophilum str. CRT38]KJV88343.1 hypothetical protein APHCRT_0163 [Anaplasma phagocytophilum str. CRT53-1]